MIPNPTAAVLALTALAIPLFGDEARAQREDLTKQFRIEVEHSRLPAISQGRTGTCWAFATTSFVESELERMHGTPINLSELHTVYYGYIEKARRYVRLHGKTQFDEGGLCHDVMYLIGKYGAVPQSEFTGLCEGDRGHDHAEMVAILKGMVEHVAKSQRPSAKWQAAFRGVLDGYLGPVPEVVEVDGKQLTPKEYSRRVLKLEPKDYRQLTSFAGEPYWEKMELLVPDNWMRHAGYWNVPLETMMDRLESAVRAGFTVAVDIDVSEPTKDSRYVWTLPGTMERRGAVSEAMRQRMFDARETTDDHLMHIVGIARHQDGRTFYLIKNSWGQRGPYRGHWMASANYLRAKMLSFMVHKDALDAVLVKRFE